MTVGSPTTTAKGDVVKGLAYTCLQTINTRGSETQEFPTKPCPAGIMAIHHFPASVQRPPSTLQQYLFLTNHPDAGMERTSIAQTTNPTCTAPPKPAPS